MIVLDSQENFTAFPLAQITLVETGRTLFLVADCAAPFLLKRRINSGRQQVGEWVDLINHNSTVK